MTSQISIRKLVKLELKQNSWMLALSSLGHFLLAPVLFLLTIADYYPSDLQRIVDRHCSFFSNGYFLAQIMMMILCISFNIFSYRYLFSRRMMDLYHSVPITRGKLFLVKYLHGFIIWFLPFAAGGLSSMLLSFIRLNVNLTPAYAGEITLSLLQSMLLLLLCYFIFYHLFLAAVYLSGNVLNLFTNVAIMGFSVVCIYCLCMVFAERFFDTFCTTMSVELRDVLYSLSPFTSPFAIYSYWNGNPFPEFITEHALLLIISIIVSILQLLTAHRLYLNRPSELAGRGTLNKYYVVPARLAATLLSALAGAYFFGEIVSGSARLAWGIFGALLCGILAFGALNSIYQTTIKAFFSNKAQMAAITASGILLIMAFQLDWFGYDRYLPDKEDIAGAAIYMYTFSDDSSQIVLDDEAGFVYSGNSHRVKQKELLTDQNFCYDFLNLAAERSNAAEYSEGMYFYTKVKLKNGRTYYRRYFLNASDYQMLAPFIESEEYKNTNYKISTGALGYPATAEVTLSNAQISFKLNEETIRDLMDAYWRDFAQHYNLEELSSYMYSVRLDLQYQNNLGDYFYSYLTVPDYYTNTLKYLESLYPEYQPYPTSPEQIAFIRPYAYRSHVEKYGSLYGYFGMDGYETTDTGTAREQATSTDDPAFIEIADSKNQYGAEYYLEITDRELLEELYPLLYFGEYAGAFDKRDYIFFADVQTKDGNFISCYVKPNTLPEEIIEMLDEGLKESLAEE